jgi:hypothetical protein
LLPRVFQQAGGPHAILRQAMQRLRLLVEVSLATANMSRLNPKNWKRSKSRARTPSPCRQERRPPTRFPADEHRRHAGEQCRVLDNVKGLRTVAFTRLTAYREFNRLLSIPRLGRDRWTLLSALRPGAHS